MVLVRALVVNAVREPFLVGGRGAAVGHCRRRFRVYIYIYSTYLCTTDK